MFNPKFQEKVQGHKHPGRYSTGHGEENPLPPPPPTPPTPPYHTPPHPTPPHPNVRNPRLLIVPVNVFLNKSC